MPENYQVSSRNMRGVGYIKARNHDDAGKTPGKTPSPAEHVYLQCQHTSDCSNVCLRANADLVNMIELSIIKSEDTALISDCPVAVGKEAFVFHWVAARGMFCMVSRYP